MASRVHKLLAPALLLPLLAAAFTFDQHGVRWLWSAQPGVAVVLALGAAICRALLLLALAKRDGG